MKKLIALFLFLFLADAGAQNPFYDALVLKDSGCVLVGGKVIFKKKDSLVLARILKKYSKEGITYYSELQNEFETNPFIRMPRIGSQSSGNAPLDIKGVQSAFDRGTKFLGDLDVTNFADGLAKFLVKRVKEELSTAFFTQFKKDLTDPKYGDLQILFPQTFKTLQSIDKDVYQFSIYLDALRESFTKDLSNEFVNIQKLLNQPKYQEVFKKEPGLYAILRSSLYIINELASGKHPGDVLAEYTPSNYLTNIDKELADNITASVKTVQLISSSFRSKVKDKYWASADSIFIMLGNDTAFRIYMGLLYQVDKYKTNIRFVTSDGRGTSLTELLALIGNQPANLIDSLDKYRSFIRDFSNSCQEINEYMADLKGKKKAEIDYNDYYKVFNAGLDLFSKSISALDLPYVNLKDESKVKQHSATWVYVARTCSDLYVDVRTTNYTSVVLNTLNLLDTLIDYRKNATRDYILKYGTFMAAVAKAQNSDEVEEAIESITLPAGSYRLKREVGKNICINSYVGLFGGAEHITKADKKAPFAYGITAPVGVAFSCASRKGYSSSLFVSVIDIGAVTAFRFQNDSISQVPTIQLKNILSPGMFYSLGLKKLPLSLNWGVQIGPNLRTVSSTTNNYSGSLYWRASFSIVVDIPLLNLKTRPVGKG